MTEIHDFRTGASTAWQKLHLTIVPVLADEALLPLHRAPSPGSLFRPIVVPGNENSLCVGGKDRVNLILEATIHLGAVVRLRVGHSFRVYVVTEKDHRGRSWPFSNLRRQCLEDGLTLWLGLPGIPDEEQSELRGAGRRHRPVDSRSPARTRGDCEKD